MADTEEETPRSGLPAPTPQKAEEPIEEVELIRKQLRPQLDSLPPEKREIVVQTVQRIVENYAGPLPHPKHFAAFEQALPGSADRILRMAEKEQDQRHKTEADIISTEGRFALSGQVFGLVVMIGLIGGAAWSIYMGSEIGAATFLGAGAISVALGFYNGQISWRAPSPESTPEPESIPQDETRGQLPPTSKKKKKKKR